MGIRLELKFWSETHFLFTLFKINKNYLFSKSLTALKSGLRRHEMSLYSTAGVKNALPFIEHFCK